MNQVGRVLAALPQGDFFRGVVTIAGATGAAQLIGILSSPIITRLYSPSDYGAFAVAGAVLTLLVSIACLRYELAIPLPKGDADAANVFVLCLLVTLGISAASDPRPVADRSVADGHDGRARGRARSSCCCRSACSAAAR